MSCSIERMNPTNRKAVSGSFEMRNAHQSQNWWNGTGPTDMSQGIVNLVNPGYGYHNRVGREIWMERVVISGDVIYEYTPSPEVSGDTSAGNLRSNTIRVLLVYDKTPAESIGDIDPKELLGGMSIGNVNHTTMFSTKNLEWEERFIILYDEYHEFTVQATPFNPAPIS